MLRGILFEGVHLGCILEHRKNQLGGKRSGVEGGGRAVQEDRTAGAKALGTEGPWCMRGDSEAGVVGATGTGWAPWVGSEVAVSVIPQSPRREAEEWG